MPYHHFHLQEESWESEYGCWKGLRVLWNRRRLSPLRLRNLLRSRQPVMNTRRNPDSGIIFLSHTPAVFTLGCSHMKTSQGMYDTNKIIWEEITCRPTIIHCIFSYMINLYEKTWWGSKPILFSQPPCLFFTYSAKT